MPALQISISIFETCEVISLAAACTDASDFWSQETNVKVVVGLMALPVLMTVSLAAALRPVKKMRAGRWWDRVWIVWAPRPAVPVMWS
jgi:hypothetical protein